MLRKLLKSLIGGSSHSHGHKYKKYSSSSSSRRRYSRKHDYYGHKHYKKGKRSSFFSS